MIRPNLKLIARELKAHRKGLFFWILGMLAMTYSGMAKFAALESGGQSVNELMNQLPKSITAIFGMSGFDISQPSGYYGVLFIYIVLIAAVHAILLGTDLIAKEERDKTSEFLFVRPISRSSATLSKIIAGLINLTILNIITLVTSIYFVSVFAETSSINDDIIILNVGLFILQILFFFVGTAVAAIVKKPKKSASIATSFLLTTYVISFLININQQLDFLKYLTPFKYFDAKTIIDSGALDPIYIAISLVLISGLTVMTFVGYRRRDLSI